MELGQRIKQARLEAGLSQRQLAGEQMTRNMLSCLEHDKAKPSLDTLVYLSQALGKPVGYFLGEEGPQVAGWEALQEARQLYDAGDWRQCLKALTQVPEGEVLGRECAMLRLLATLCLGEQAADQGRDVFVVPGNIDIPSFVGSNRLLRDGAIAVSSGWDVMSEYEALFPGKITKNDAPARQIAYPDEVRAQPAEEVLKVAQTAQVPAKKERKGLFDKKKEIDNTATAPYIDAEKPKPQLNAEEDKLLSLLGSQERLVDDVIAEAGLSAGQVLAALTMLEIKGLITRLPGKRIMKK